MTTAITSCPDDIYDGVDRLFVETKTSSFRVLALAIRHALARVRAARLAPNAKVAFEVTLKNIRDRLNAGVISCAGALVFLSQLLAKLATAAKSVLGRGAAAIISFCRRGTLERKPSNSDKEAPEAEKESDSGSSCSDVDYPDPDDVDALVCDLGHEAPTAQCDANIWLSRTASLKTKRRASLVDSARGSLPTVSYSAVE